MKIQLWAIGKPHDKELKAAIDQFTQRCNNYFQVEWNIIAGPKNAGQLEEAGLKKKEGEMVLQLLEKNDYLVALDEGGQQLTSEGLADFINARANESTRKLIFLIGGAYGLDEAVLAAARLKWSLSKLTFPHQLVRLVLAEQLYRSFTILRNEKYHHK
ncbi:MAG TPA: 23S rRNA (pseudouridine(1915)-N(3))-methyltransferase RlmH [Chitinophagaceae bacterium]|nr:23S rRNA (pseudouridine(1915)-N(3))-methyltransferase RlmH [Chitinophagaceae bacterium]